MNGRNEADTRAEDIDPKLKEAGWGIIEGSKITREYPITIGRLIGNGRRDKRLFADYVLQYNGQNIAIVEAKRSSINYKEGIAQAKEYAKRLQVRFTFATNGNSIYSIDMNTGDECNIEKYPSPDELWNKLYYDIKDKNEYEWRTKFTKISFNDKGGLWSPRYYQENAINATLNAIAKGKKRILITLATGTGKTAISFQIVWKLSKAYWNNSSKYEERSPRVLFLADRNILADQALNAYNGFEDNALIRLTPELIKKEGKLPINGSIFFTIYQTLMGYSNNKPNYWQYQPDFFDLIIIDECHRGGSNDESEWRDILEYFSSAVQLGMTATPKRSENADTYQYFGNPVYVYSLKEGINDGFLTPFRVQEIETNMDNYQFYVGDEVIEGDIDINKTYDLDDQNRIIEIMQLEEYRVKKLLELIDQKQKTIIFCASQNHAAAIMNLINQNVINKNVSYCCRVTANDGNIGEQHLREFQDNDRSIPTMLTTSVKLSTGVDAPELRNIVLLRPVKQMIEFKQIIGRGTRLYDGKDYFTIYDFVGAHKNFKDPEWDGDEYIPNEKYDTQPKRKKEGDKDKNESFTDDDKHEPEQKCMVRVKLSDGREREIDSVVKTSFYDPSGKPISCELYIKKLYGDLPSFFSSEEELRKIWSDPFTRKQLREKLAEVGYTDECIGNLSALIHAENSDIIDVLLYFAYRKPIIERSYRATNAQKYIKSYSEVQQEFINFVLSQYTYCGVDELNIEKISQHIELKYNDLKDGICCLGNDIEEISNIFVEFQKYLYNFDSDIIND